MMPMIRIYWPELLLAAALVFLSIWQLPFRPATWFDEGINVGIAKALVEHGVYSVEIAPGEFVRERPFLITTNYPVLLPVALSLKSFGLHLTAARLPMTFFLLGFAVVAYVLVRRLYGRETALWSTALLISFVPLYGNGRPVLGEVPGLFFFLTALLVIPSDSNRAKLFASGALFGLAVATKPFFFIILPALAVGEWVAHWRSGFLARRLVLLSSGIFLPLIGWFYSILPEPSFAGFADTIAFYANSYASRDLLSLVGQNLLRFVTESTPLHFLALLSASAVFLWRRSRYGEPLRETEWILGVFIVVTVLFYLKTPGWYRYFFPAHLSLFLFFPAALLFLLSRRAAVITILGLFLVQSVHLVLQSDEPLYYSRDAEETAEAIQKHTAPGESVFLVNKPSVAFLLTDRAVYQYLEINPILHFGSISPVTPDGASLLNMYD